MRSANLSKVEISEAELKEINSWLPNGFRFGTWSNCFYCGTEPTESEHVVPYSMITVQKGIHSVCVGATTPACHECNVILSNFYFDTLADRAEYVNKRLRRKHSKFLHMESWQEWEMNGLSRTLRSHIHCKQQQRQIAVQRCTWQFKKEFTELFEEAYKQAKDQHPENIRFHAFMKPKWI